MKKMDKSEFQGLVRSLIEDAIEYVDDELSPKRAKKTDYYNGEMIDLEGEEGRSSIVSRDVRDTVKAMMPSIIRGW